MTDDTLVRLATGELDLSSDAGVEEHIAQCSVCRRLVAEAASDDGTAHTLSPADRARRSSQPSMSSTKIGPYMPISILGSGGMGTVWRAYDPRLAREVALKIVAFAHANKDSVDEARNRLLREAQTLARLSDPGIVTVFDVGAVGDDMYVAMELVHGKTFRQWQAEDRAKEEVIRMYARAARALAAAHEVGIVHRDFKPENVMVTEAGQIKVLDFGLARAMDRPASPSEQAIDSSELVVTRSTITGTLMGTPAYMSPEQVQCGKVGPRSDQFSFCVSLYEALVGSRPFAARTIGELLDAFARAEVDFPNTGKDQVPAHVQRAIKRGLAMDPEARFSDFHELLDELAPRPVRWRRWGVAAGIGVASVLSVLVLTGGRSGPDCSKATSELEGVWDEDRRVELHAAHERAGLSDAIEAIQLLEQQMDGYAKRWVSLREDSCRATHDRGTQSVRLLDVRMRCLDRRRLAFSAFVDALAQSKSRTDWLAAGARVRLLGNLESCADVESLGQLPALPQDPVVRDRVRGVEEQLDDLAGRGRFMKPAKRLAEAKRISLQARAIGFAPLSARVLYELGTAQLEEGEQESAGHTLKKASELAARAHDDRLAARIWVALLHALERQSRYDDVLTLEPVARAAVVRAGDEGSMRADLLRGMGWALTDVGRYRDAEASYREAIRAVEEGQNDYDLSRAYYGLGIVLREQGRYREAAENLRQAMDLSKRLLGSDHPHSTMCLSHLARALKSLGQYDEAEALYRQAMELQERTLEPGHPKLGFPHVGIAEVFLAQKKPRLAQKHLEKADRIWRQRLKSPRFEFATVTWYRGLVKELRGDHAGAIALFQAAIGEMEQTVGTNHPSVAGILGPLARSLLALDRAKEARGYSERAVTLFRQRAAQPGRLGAVELIHATVLVALKETREAREVLPLAIANLKKGGRLFDSRRRAAEALLRRIGG